MMYSKSLCFFLCGRVSQAGNQDTAPAIVPRNYYPDIGTLTLAEIKKYFMRYQESLQGRSGDAAKMSALQAKNQSLQDKNRTLKEQNESLKEENKALKEKLDKIQSLLASFN